MMIKPFMKWYGDPITDLRIKIPKSLPQYTAETDIDKVIDTIETKRSAKNTIERDVLLVLTSRYAGLRREELSNLRVKDITKSYLFVREGKGLKDRNIPLSSVSVCVRLLRRGSASAVSGCTSCSKEKTW
jgi:site-specific recombinase XerD